LTQDWGPLKDRYGVIRPRKLLALDGGGIRGVMTLAILKAIEQKVGQKLCDYFDYIAGTSTGAIIAAGLARGLSVDDLIDFYRQTGTGMFQRTRFLDRLNSLYQNGPLEKKLKEVFGEKTNLRPGQLRTLLLVVTRNITTDSPWPISSNPEARYNMPSNQCNLEIPVWKLVRASTAAPIFFPPEVITLHPNDPSKSFVFVDGGMTPYNNPAFLLFRFATDPAYRLNWPKGEDKMLLISVGTGAAPTLGAGADDPESNMLSTGLTVPGALMYGASVDQDINCRAIGRCTYGPIIDRELLDMIPREGDDTGSTRERLARPKLPLNKDLGRAFLYARYNVDLSREGLDALGFPEVDSKDAQKMDNASPENIERLLKLGTAAGKQVDLSHFGPFAPQ
jgi:uncharacterized protein